MNSLVVFLTSCILLLVSTVVIVELPISAAAATTTSSSSAAAATKSSPRLLVVGVDGGTESIRACCFDALTGQVVGASCAVPYPTRHPKPGWAEQEPTDWYHNLGQAVQGAVASVLLPDNNNDDDDDDDDNNNNTGYRFCAMALDTTCCSVVALDNHYQPLRPCLLWMDQRSAPQTKQIMETTTTTSCRRQGRRDNDPALSVNCGGKGPLSAEWMTPKALWIRQNEYEDVWNKAKTICEYQDYLNYRLTGVMVASSCNAASRWHWNGETCIQQQQQQQHHADGKYPGRPLSLYRALGIPELATKLPQKCLPMGVVVGGLTKEAAEHLNLPVDLPVVQGGADAFVGMIGLGCIHPGQLCLITGSSHLHCVVTSQPSTAPGIWGAYKGAPLPGINFAEGGQSSTGSILRWARMICTNNEVSYAALDDEASLIDPGAHGLVALETFQGSRTPVTDPFARGAFLGLTLSHTRAHIWRALLEAVCFGTRACIEGLSNAGHVCDEIIIAGGATRSPLWLQLHADVTGKPVVVCENSDAPLLGCAILASVGVGIHASVQDAVNAMVRTAQRIQPNPDVVNIYSKLYENVYRKVADAARPVAHAIHDELTSATDVRGGSQDPSPLQKRDVIISPSLLACDWANIEKEVYRCCRAGARVFHVDVFDGVFLDSPEAFTFGPQMVQAIRKSCDTYGPFGRDAILDLHVCVDRPARFVNAMARAGGNRFIFQWEAMEDTDEAADLAQLIHQAGMKSGVSLNPETDIEQVLPLLATKQIDVVDLLSVNPGFGGQDFQEHVLEKIETLRKWRDEYGHCVDIMVDGGVNGSTAERISNAGADILVSGSYLFQFPDGMKKAIQSLRQQV